MLKLYELCCVIVLSLNCVTLVPKKKKKKHSHHRGDQVKVANLQRFSNMVHSLFDQQMSEGNVYHAVVLVVLLLLVLVVVVVVVMLLLG